MIKTYIFIVARKTILEKKSTELFDWRSFVPTSCTKLQASEVVSNEDLTRFTIDTNVVFPLLFVLGKDSSKGKVNR